MIDTSVIVDNPQLNLLKLKNGDNEIYITEIVLAEMDKHKTSKIPEVAWAARAFHRSLDKSEFIENKNIKLKSKSDKIYTVVLQFETDSVELNIIVRDTYRKETLSSESVNDAKIMEVAFDYKLKCVTNDISFKAIAMSKGLEAESIYWNALENPDEVEFLHNITDVELQKLEEEHKLKKWHQYVVSQTNDGNLTGKKEFSVYNGSFLEQIKTEEVKAKADEKKSKIKPINLEQKFYNHLLEQNFDVMVVTGSTGSGKTLLALYNAMKKVKDKNSPINGIVYLRYTVEVEDKFSALGFRKGDESTKLGYFSLPLYTNLNLIADVKGENGEVENAIKRNEKTDALIKEYNIEEIDIAHARGITLANKVVIFDEVQNAPDNILLLIGTRLGENAKLILMGDYNQVDHPYLSRQRNGLISMLKIAQKDDYVACVKLKDTVRSKAAEWFQKSFT